MSGFVERVKSWLFADDDEMYGPPGDEEESRSAPRRRGGIIPIHSRSGQIFIRRPRDQDEARACVDCLRDRRAVVINLKEIDATNACRIFDFVAGATYALGGQLEQAGDGVYLATPHNIDILAEEEEDSGARQTAFWQEV
jgi:cell division inhibitor SepF